MRPLLGLLGALAAAPAAAQGADALATEAAAQLGVIVALGRPGPGGVTLTAVEAEGAQVTIAALADASRPEDAGPMLDLLCAAPPMAALLAAGGTGVIELRTGTGPAERLSC